MSRYIKLASVVIVQLLKISAVVGPILLIVFLGAKGLLISVILAWLLVCPFACSHMAANKGRSKSGGFFVGLVLGVFGLLIMWFLTDSTEMRIRKEVEMRKMLDGE